MNYNELMDELEKIEALEDKLLSSDISTEEKKSSQNALIQNAKEKMFLASDLSDLHKGREMFNYLYDNLELSGSLTEQSMEILYWSTIFREMIKISLKK